MTRISATRPSHRVLDQQDICRYSVSALASVEHSTTDEQAAWAGLNRCPQFRDPGLSFMPQFILAINVERS
jgi:hypothetical protein